ncbi:MAG: hypothetical protein GY762_17435 [Proteobacteria bacterium]|nr:hypothetical protein [Pseudomonadota bacterium]
MQLRSGFVGRIGGAVLGAVSVMVIIATVRLVLSGRQHLEEAMRLQDANDSDRAIAEFEDTVRAYVPGSPYPSKALRELDILAKGAEMRGDVDRARSILEVTRRAILSTRHVRQPFDDRLQATEKSILRLVTRHRGLPTNGAGRLITRPSDPGPTASILLFIGLLCWAGGGIGLLLQPKSAANSSMPSPFVALIVSLAGLATWIAMAWIAG